MRQLALNIDCLEYMKTCKDKQFNLAIVDPPYGIGADNFSNGTKGSWKSTAVKSKKNRLNSGGGKLKNRKLNNSDCSWDFPPTKEYFDELFRISENQIIWGGNYFDLPPTRCIIFWDKLQPWENFSQFELAWTSFDKPAKKFAFSTRGGANSEVKIHPTQKPVALYKWILSNFAKEGDTIFDSHLGSGSSRIAAYDLGFEFVGCEISKDYFDLQEKRFKEHCCQLELFEMKGGKVV